MFKPRNTRAPPWMPPLLEEHAPRATPMTPREKISPTNLATPHGKTKLFYRTSRRMTGSMPPVISYWGSPTSGSWFWGKGGVPLSYSIFDTAPYLHMAFGRSLKRQPGPDREDFCVTNKRGEPEIPLTNTHSQVYKLPERTATATANVLMRTSTANGEFAPAPMQKETPPTTCVYQHACRRPSANPPCVNSWAFCAHVGNLAFPPPCIPMRAWVFAA